MFKKYCFAHLLLCFFVIWNNVFAQTNNTVSNVISLAGKWQFKIDSTDVGEVQHWFNKKLDSSITLPCSLTTNNICDDITVNTPWTGSIFDSSWFSKPEYAKYRKPGNIKVPFWLQTIKYYKGAAWYQKEISIPLSWNTKHISLFL